MADAQITDVAPGSITCVVATLPFSLEASKELPSG